MLVRDLMTPDPITVTPECSVAEALIMMEQSRIRHLLVVTDGFLVGIVTDRDIRLNLPSPATSLSVWEVNYLLRQLTVQQVMTKRVVTTDPDISVREAARVLLERKIGALPVLEGRRLVGILTETDVLRGFVAGADRPESTSVATH